MRKLKGFMSDLVHRESPEWNHVFKFLCCGHSPTGWMCARLKGSHDPVTGWQRVIVRESPACGWVCYEIYPGGSNAHEMMEETNHEFFSEHGS